MRAGMHAATIPAHAYIFVYIPHSHAHTYILCRQKHSHCYVVKPSSPDDGSVVLLGQAVECSPVRHKVACTSSLQGEDGRGWAMGRRPGEGLDKEQAQCLNENYAIYEGGGEAAGLGQYALEAHAYVGVDCKASFICCC